MRATKPKQSPDHSDSLRWLRQQRRGVLENIAELQDTARELEALIAALLGRPIARSTRRPGWKIIDGQKSQQPSTEDVEYA